ncbi:MAG: hypothetical protein HY761_08050 [Candidatus Omnitrophica bacterium]|nr:hypothetical protein [Candidatus Omnitrophota bacterium]
MFLKNIFITVFFLSFLLTAFAQQQQESLTITTYYPSPFGSYNELVVASRVAVGDVNHDGKVDSGDLPVAGQMNLVPANGSLVVANSIGINTVNPQSALDVNGDMKVSGTFFPGGQSYGFKRIVFGTVKLGPSGWGPTSTGLGFTVADQFHNSMTSCSKVTFSTAFSNIPHIIVSRNSGSADHYQWEMGAYIASTTSFTICATYCPFSNCNPSSPWNSGYVGASFIAME